MGAGSDVESREYVEKFEGGVRTYTAERRARLSGPSGIEGLLKQPRLLKLALITTLGAVS